jgi:hypothetical protein
MSERYKQACSAYLKEFIKREPSPTGFYTGWYHFIEDPAFHTVGVVATAQTLILIKDDHLPVQFDCTPMLQSLLEMQREDGGWSYRSNLPGSSTEPTALSVQALVLWRESGGAQVLAAIRRGVSWLLKFQNEACLWGPVNKKELHGYTYFTCSVLQCLNRLLEAKNDVPAADNLEKILGDSCRALLGLFSNCDSQCGWGETDTAQPTIFHTAYVVLTLLQINPGLCTEYPIVKSVSLLCRFLEDAANGGHYPFRDGENEIYQYETHRLSYTHSTDVYVIQGIMVGLSGQTLPQIVYEKYRDYLKCAENTDWRYRGFKTSWRMFDIMRLCGSFEKMGSKGETGVNHYRIAFTFAGESRAIVEKVADLLAKKYSKDEILYDKYHEAEFARPQLDSYLQDLYHNHSDLIVVFICEQYSQKRWCGVEWRAIRDILNSMKFEKIMYVKAFSGDPGDLSLPGFFASEDGYVDAERHTCEELADLIDQRYRQLS